MSLIKHCYVIQRKVTGQTWTIQGEHHNPRPSVIAFRDSSRAHSFLRLLKDMESDKKYKQALVIEKTKVATMYRRCALNSLDFTLVDHDGSFIEMPHFDTPNDDVVFHLENSLLWF